MSDKVRVGEVFTYFAGPSVAGVKLTDGELAVGDKISIEGHTTNLEQTVESMQIDRSPIEKAEQGQEIGLRVSDRVRPQDAVYKITASGE